MPIAVSDAGDVTIGNDDRCTRYTYNRNLSAWITQTTSRTETVSVSCDATPTRPQQVVTDERSYYDGHTGLDTPPSNGLLTKVETLSDWSSGPVYAQRARTEYDALGRIVATYDGLNRRTSSVQFVPATDGPVTQVLRTDAKGFVNTTTLEPAWGAALTEVDPNGRRTDLLYDPSGRLLNVWLPDRSRAAGAGASIGFGYSLSKTAPNWVRSVELLPDGAYKRSVTLLDGLLRQRQVQTPGANGTGRLVADTTYDARGNGATESGAYYDAASAPTTSLFDVPEQNLPSQTVHLYDGADREVASVFKVQNSERWRTTTIHGGNATSVRPPTGGTATTTVIDIRGRVTELRQFHNGTTSGGYDSTTYSYTPRDELASVTNEAGTVWRYGYDLRGRQISAIDPDKGTTTSSYDDADRLTSVRDARGQALFYAYDELDRKTAVRSGSATGTVLATWSYDTLGKGLLTSSTRVVNGSSYISAITGYDALDRPTGTRTTIPASEGKLAGTYTTSNRYFTDGSVDAVTLPHVPGLPDETLQVRYTAAGLPRALGGWGAYVSDTLHSSYGEPLRIAMGPELEKSAWQSFSYEEGTRRLLGMRVDRENQQTTDDTFSYGYDAAGNPTSTAHVSTAGADRQCFRVDHLRRLTDAWTPASGTCTTDPSTALAGVAPYWHSYTYSASGNRTSVVEHSAAGDTTRTYAYPTASAARPHALNSVTSSGPGGSSLNSYTYDAAGNLATRTEGGDTDTFGWDAEGHLASVSGQDGTTSFVYDAQGARLIKRDPAGATLYLESTEVRWDRASDAVSSTRYYEFDGQTVAMRTGWSAVELLMADPHNTATVSVDAYSTAVSRRLMDPFGNVRSQSSAWEPNSHGFVDGVIDGSTRLTHLGAREYGPKTGRFVSVDPLVDVNDPQTLNGYRYGNNNPVSYSDPTGLGLVLDLPNGGKAVVGDADKAKSHYNHVAKQRKWHRDERAANPGQAVREEIDRQVSYHREQKEVAKKRIKRVVKDLVKIVADELGVTDALNCFTNGDLGSCLATGINVLASFAGGIAGKLLAKYGAPWKWKRAAGLIARIKGLAGEAVEGIKGWRAASKGLRDAEQALGIVYRRTDADDGKPYIGQAKSEDRFYSRQAEHARANPDADFSFEVIDRAPAGVQLDRHEEFYIRQGGGPTNKGNPGGGLANKRHQMNAKR